MKARALWLAPTALVAALWLASRRGEPASWAGVDEAVIGRFAEAAGRSESGPLFEALQGDLLLFAFLWAGLLAGFVIGYASRALFVEGVGRPAGEGSRHGE